MTVPARSPIPIPGSTADIIEVAGAVMTKEVEIKIQKYRRILWMFVYTWSSYHRISYNSWHSCCCPCSCTCSTCGCSSSTSDLEEAAELSHEAREVREVEAGQVRGLVAGAKQKKEAEDLVSKVSNVKCEHWCSIQALRLSALLIQC